MSDNQPSLNFHDLPVVRNLTTLAKSPPDLTTPETLDPGRIERFRSSACGFDLLYATQRISETIMNGLARLSAEARAIERFQNLMEGKVMNLIEGFESEQRQVLHFASRNQFSDLPDPFPAPDAAEAISTAGEELERLKRFSEKLEQGELTNDKNEPFTDLINIGIGGSDLGPRALYLALLPYRQKGRRVHFISNVDPDDAAQVLATVNLSRTLVNVVSKSGETLETLTNETLVREAFKRHGLRPEKHFVCVTGKGSPMDNPEQYRASFYMYDYIGGRFSATSMVGAVLLSFAFGFDGFHEMLRGAREMDLASLNPDLSANPALTAALLGIWNRNFLGLQALAVLPYSQGLARFTAHLQQLDMESNGKQASREGHLIEWETGPMIFGEPGTNGQHAFYQFIHQSRTVIPCEFIGFRESQFGEDISVQETSSQQKLVANMLAQSIALARGQHSPNPNKCFPGNRPNSVLMAEKLTPRTLGGLLAFYENKIAFQGLIWNINSYDQEGVQLGKVLADNLLGQIRAAESGQTASNHKENADPTGWALLRAAGMV